MELTIDYAYAELVRITLPDGTWLEIATTITGDVLVADQRSRVDAVLAMSAVEV